MLIATEGASLDVFTDWRTVTLVAGVAVFAGVLTGVAPAILSGHGDLATSLKAGAREGTFHRSRTRVALLIAQGALSVVLLLGAGMFVKSLRNVKAMRIGYDGWISIEEASKTGPDALPAAIAFVDRVWAEAGGTPRAAVR